MKLIRNELIALKRNQIKNRRIVLIGRIEHLVIMINWLHENECSVDAIIDNDAKKQGQ